MGKGVEKNLEMLTDKQQTKLEKFWNKQNGVRMRLKRLGALCKVWFSEKMINFELSLFNEYPTNYDLPWRFCFTGLY
uniref:Uncharacterized protein n=1 Tax=Romanomermis culicivorax TaxID=13658 RepID=A0A915J0V2_ROMCU